MKSEDLAAVELEMIDGSSKSMSEFLENVVLIVNVASRCGFSPQYGRLESLHKELGPHGFTVLGLPSNQFQQELDSEESIKAYCDITWGVTFPMTKRVVLDGPAQHPLYGILTKSAFEDKTSGPVRWNFEKFLAIPGGSVYRFGHDIKPDNSQIVDLIKANLLHQ